MTFDTASGTRGARQPPTALRKSLNRWIVTRIRRNGGTFMKLNALILTTTGAKTGAERSTPVACFPTDDGDWLIVAAGAGSARNPDWYHNIAAHPGHIHAEAAGQKIDVTAEQLHGAKRDAAWKQIVATAPRFAKFQKKTDREFPIIALKPRSP